MTKTSVAYYKKTKLKESDKNKILTISKKINEFDLQPLVDEIAELKIDIKNKKQEIKESIDSCGFSPQTIAQLKKEKITAKDKTLLKKLNQEILDIKQKFIQKKY